MPALPAAFAPLTLLATFEADADEGLLLMMLGMGVVFGALILLWGVLELLRRTVGRPEPSTAPKPVAVAPAAALPATPPMAAAGDETELDALTLAILTAAAIAVVGAPVRLTSVSLVPKGEGEAWATRGRIAIHTSHKLRRGHR
ncbi:MAG: OadG family protein [Candidatus Sumerlaeia bacterium]|nr:OadG family protein [Candidatus Sumerlaeia bacterium]